jgi:hypothetical protein
MVGVINHSASMPPLVVVAAAVVLDGRLLVVSKRAAPDVFYLAGIDGEPRPAAELAGLRWVTGREDDVRLAPAVRDHVLPALFREAG